MGLVQILIFWGGKRAAVWGWRKWGYKWVGSIVVAEGVERGMGLGWYCGFRGVREGLGGDQDYFICLAVAGVVFYMNDRDLGKE